LFNEEYRRLRDDEMYLTFEIDAITEKAQRLIENSNLGKRFKERTFDTFDQSRCKTAYETALKYAREFDSNEGQGILFTGTYGTGKTHLAAAITNYIISEFGISVKFGTFIDLLANIKASFSKDCVTSEEDLVNAMMNIDLLVIDDIGKEKNTEWSNAILYRLINRRYENYKPTIITSNLSIAELENEIGKATVSRIIEMCDGVKMDGSDYRKEKLK